MCVHSSSSSVQELSLDCGGDFGEYVGDSGVTASCFGMDDGQYMKLTDE